MWTPSKRRPFDCLQSNKCAFNFQFDLHRLKTSQDSVEYTFLYLICFASFWKDFVLKN